MRYMHMGLRLTILISLAAAPSAQAQQWNLSAQAGRMRASLDPASAATSISAALDYRSPSATFRLSTGVPTSSVESLWAGAAAWKRAALRGGGFMAGVDLSANGFVTRDRTSRPAPTRPPVIPGPFNPPLEEVADRSGHAVAGQLMPVIGYEHARIHVHARAGVSRYTATFGDIETDRTVRLADVQLSLLPVPSFAILPVVRHYDPDVGDATTYAGVSAVIAHGSVSAWGSAGRWMGIDGIDLPWGVGASARILPRLNIEASARRDTFDPLYAQPAQTSWSLGLSLQVGGPVGAPAPPVPAAYENGRATISLPVSESREQPSIAGDFNGWKPVPMQKSGNAWVHTVALEPGVYNYSFVRPDGTWFVPESVAGRRDDGMGGHVAVLVVQ